MGGRGASSASKALKHNGFYNPNSKGTTSIKSLDTNEFRKKMQDGSQKSAIDAFDKLHKNSNIEYAVSVGQNGKVYEYNRGSKSSVGFKNDDVGGKVLIMHNHPSGYGLPSVQDLKSFDSWTSSKTSAIFGSKVSSIMTKTQSNKPGNMRNMINAYEKAMNKGASNVQLKGILKQYQQQGKYKIEIK